MTVNYPLLTPLPLPPSLPGPPIAARQVQHGLRPLSRLLLPVLVPVLLHHADGEGSGTQKGGRAGVLGRGQHEPHG